MLLYENKKRKLLKILQIGIFFFKKFVSKGEIKEDLGMVPSRKRLIDTISDFIESKDNCILPIIGGVGVGKTHLFWALRNALNYNYVVYISLEKIYRKFFYNIYTEFIETIGINVLRSITHQLCNEWGALERKYGFFHVVDIDKIKNKAHDMLKSHYSHGNALINVIQAITSHQLDPYRRVNAENWLLGDLMDFKELSILELEHDLSNNKYAYTILKLFIENAQLDLVVFIDDFDKIISLSSPENEEEEVFDPSWLYGKSELGENDSSEERTVEKIMDKLFNLLKIKRLKCIMTLRSLDDLEKIREQISQKYQEKLSLIKEPLFLTDFERNDIFHLYRENLKIFLKNIGFSNLFEEGEDPYYPLNEKILHNVYSVCGGNPRKIIKNFINIFNELTMSNETLEEIKAKYENIDDSKMF